MIDTLIGKLNKNQKKLFLILVPIFFYIVFFPIADEYSTGGMSILHLDFNLDDVWWVWLIYLTIVGYLEFKILSKLD